MVEESSAEAAAAGPAGRGGDDSSSLFLDCRNRRLAAPRERGSRLDNKDRPMFCLANSSKSSFRRITLYWIFSFVSATAIAFSRHDGRSLPSVGMASREPHRPETARRSTAFRYAVKTQPPDEPPRSSASADPPATSATIDTKSYLPLPRPSPAASNSAACGNRRPAIVTATTGFP